MHLVKVGSLHINLDTVAYVHDTRGHTAHAVAGVWLEFIGPGGDENLSLRLQDDEASLLATYLDQRAVDLAAYADELAERAARAQAQAQASYRGLGEIPFA